MSGSCIEIHVACSLFSNFGAILSVEVEQPSKDDNCSRPANSSPLLSHNCSRLESFNSRAQSVLTFWLKHFYAFGLYIHATNSSTMSSSSVESDSIFNSTGSCNHDSDSDTDADDDKNDSTNRRRKLSDLLNLLLIRRQYLRQRQPKCTPPRLVWTDYVSQLIQQNEFSVTFRMSLLAFNKLVEILRDDLEVHYHQALRS